MLVVGVAEIRIACRLCLAYLTRQGRGPLRRGEHAALMKRQHHGKGAGLPWLIEHRAGGVPRHSRQPEQRLVRHAGSRYGSKASTEIVDRCFGFCLPHSSFSSKATVYSHCGFSPKPRALVSGNTCAPWTRSTIPALPRAYAGRRVWCAG